MTQSPRSIRALLFLPLALLLFAAKPAAADGDVHKVTHIIVIMQENHSFDNYFGAPPELTPSRHKSKARPAH